MKRNVEESVWNCSGRIAETVGYLIDGASIACLLTTHGHHGLGPAVMVVAVLRAWVAGFRPHPVGRLALTLHLACTVLDGATIALIVVTPHAVTVAIGVEVTALLVRLLAIAARGPARSVPGGRPDNRA